MIIAISVYFIFIEYYVIIVRFINTVIGDVYVMNIKLRKIVPFVFSVTLLSGMPFSSSAMYSSGGSCLSGGVCRPSESYDRSKPDGTYRDGVHITIGGSVSPDRAAYDSRPTSEVPSGYQSTSYDSADRSSGGSGSSGGSSGIGGSCGSVGSSGSGHPAVLSIVRDGVISNYDLCDYRMDCLYPLPKNMGGTQF